MKYVFVPIVLCMLPIIIISLGIFFIPFSLYKVAANFAATFKKTKPVEKKTKLKYNKNDYLWKTEPLKDWYC